MHMPSSSPWPRRIAAAAFTGSTLGLLAGCAASPASLTPDVLLLGEQHDAPDHAQRHLQTVREFTDRQQLAALALEMAEQGASTAGIGRDADEAQVRAALRWNETAWPWLTYGPVVMTAVRAGVPVLGANLPRSALRAAMADERLDSALPATALLQQRKAIREGHCDLLPAAQIAPMTRVQIARDRAMAQTLAAATQPGRTVVLVAGHGHVNPQLGVPMHLPAGLAVRPVTWPLPAVPARDYCGELREQLRKRAG